MHLFSIGKIGVKMKNSIYEHYRTVLGQAAWVWAFTSWMVLGKLLKLSMPVFRRALVIVPMNYYCFIFIQGQMVGDSGGGGGSRKGGGGVGPPSWNHSLFKQRTAAFSQRCVALAGFPCCYHRHHHGISWGLGCESSKKDK